MYIVQDKQEKNHELFAYHLPRIYYSAEPFLFPGDAPRKKSPAILKGESSYVNV